MQTYAGSISARVRVGVLPLGLTDTTGDDEYLGMVMCDQISSALSRFRIVSVVAPSWLAEFARDGHDERSMRSACRIDFLVSGSIQRAGDRLRIWLRMVDLRTCHRIVWANRFDWDSGSLLPVLDRIAMTAVGQIIPQILIIESQRTARVSLEGATAHDLVLRALPLMRLMDRAPFVEAGFYLARAIEREPDYSPAYTWYAFWHLFLAAQGWAQDRIAVRRKSGELAATAIVLDPGDAFAVTIDAHVNAFRHRNLSVAATQHERALALNPNLAMAWVLSAITYSCMGELGAAEKRSNQYQTFGSFDPSATFLAGFSMLIDLAKRDYEAVVFAGRTAIQLAPSLRAAYKPYLAALGHLGRVQESNFVRARLLAIEPDFSVERCLTTSPLEREADKQHLARGLRLAGVPETG